VSATSSEKKENLLATTKGKWDENIHSTERKSEGANSAGAQQELKSTDRFSFGLRRTWTIAVAGRMLEFFVVRSCRPGVRSRRLGGDCTRPGRRPQNPWSANLQAAASNPRRNT
jgi:hypothetical protein